MDNLAHALVGAAVMRAVADRHVPRAASVGILAANVPDLSELFLGLPGTRADYLVLHRGITHSLVGALVEIVGLTILIAVGWRVARWIAGRQGRAIAVPPWGWLAAGIAAAVLSHLYMDWQGSYGWRPFLPWSGTWYYLDWVAIVDPFFWLVPLVALAWGAERHWTPLAAALVAGGTITIFLVRAHDLVATWVLVVYAMVCGVAVVGWIRYWFGPVGRQRAAALALLLLGLYAGAQGVVAAGRKREIRQAAERRFGAGASWAALTNVGRPFTWEAIYSSRDTIAGDDHWRLPRHLQIPAARRALDTRDGHAIAQFARFLAAEVDTSSATVYLWDARYARSSRDSWTVLKVRIE
ncbi:MAG TPA: metal-dependent hydrolase [Gemmatimonadales bacterium]|jgi:inner membrane protein